MVEILNSLNLLTLDQHDQFIDLSTDKRMVFGDNIKKLRQAHTNSPSSHLTVFRGCSRSNLLTKLAKEGESPISEHLLSRLFYFGDKAKSFYMQTNADIISQTLPEDIEDCSEETCRRIFDKINDAFSNNLTMKTVFTCESNQFRDYFLDLSNTAEFCATLCGLGAKARDYYLYFLHTAGDAIGSTDQSVLVSTTKEYSMAKQFGGDYIIWYIIPQQIGDNAVSHFDTNGIERVLRDNKLPVYDGIALHPEEEEYSVRRAIFPIGL
jgi:hypothetical protein